MNRKLFDRACKDTLIDIIKESNHIRESLDVKNRIRMIYWINSMTYTETLSALLNDGVLLDEGGVRDYEAGYTKYLKYRFAYIAGAGAAIAAWGTKVLPYKSASKLPWIALAVTWFYRRLTDPCVQKCIKHLDHRDKRNVCKYKCQHDVGKQVLSQIESSLKLCHKTRKPEKCQIRLLKQQKKWKKKVMKQRIKLTKSKIKLAAETRPKDWKQPGGK